jgi:tetratricopeptide (TPR) repeat protein
LTFETHTLGSLAVGDAGLATLRAVSARARGAEWQDAAIAAAIAIATFSPAIGFAFVHDDHRQIAGNPLLAELRSLPALWTSGVWAGAGSGSSWYRPLMMTSFAVDRALFGLSPAAMHAVSLALHGALAAGIVIALRSLGASRPVAFGAGALGAVHPVQAEAAAWISARCELWMALFGVAALALHDRAIAAPSSRGPALRAGSALAFFLALAAKESAIVFAPLFLCVDRWRGVARADAASLRRSLPWLLALGVYLALRARALRDVSAGLLGPTAALDLAGAFGQGVVRIAAPVALTISPPPPSAFDAAIGAVAGVAALAAGAVAWRRRAPLLLPLALAAGFLAVAALGAVRIGEVADRYLLLPVYALAWLSLLGVERLRGAARRAARFALAAAGVALAASAHSHVGVYQSDATLWSDAFAKNPRSERAAANLGALALDAGDPRGALAWLARASELAPGDAQIEMNRAVAESQLGDAAAARARLDAILAAQPGYWPAALRAGHLALEAGELDLAVRHYESVLAAHGLAAEAWAGLGVARERQGRAEEARRALDRALALDPRMENAEALRALRARLDR